MFIFKFNYVYIEIFQIFVGQSIPFMGLPWLLRWQSICLQCGRPGFNPSAGKIPWRRAWQPTPVFLPGESPWTEEPDQLQSMELQGVGHD